MEREFQEGKTKAKGQFKGVKRQYEEKQFSGSEYGVETREDLVIGRNAVMELLKGSRTIESIYIASGNIEGSIKAIINMAKEKKLVLKEVDRKNLIQ